MMAPDSAPHTFPVWATPAANPVAILGMNSDASTMDSLRASSTASLQRNPSAAYPSAALLFLLRPSHHLTENLNTVK